MKLKNKHIKWLKALFHLIAITPIVALVLLVMGDHVGGEPVEYIIHYTGIGALNALVLTLIISPLAKRFKQGALLQTRRLIGLYVFAYATLHILSFVALDLLFEWNLLWQEIINRPYIIVGALSYVILFLLAITSLNSVRRKMGKRWQQLHNTVYVAALLIPVHFYWSVKSEIIEPSIYIAIMLGLLALRLGQLAKQKTKHRPSSKHKVAASPLR